MKQAYLEVFSRGACLYLPGKEKGDFSGDDLFDAHAHSLTMFANTRQALIRVQDFPASGVVHDMEWDFMKSLFPFGDKLNEATHVFDYTLYENTKGGKRALAVALPMAFAKRSASLGKSITRSILRVESLGFVEDLLIQKFAVLSQNGDSFLIMFSQDGGIRLMTVYDGMPGDVFFISNHPAFRNSEFMQFWDGHVSRLLSVNAVLYTVETDKAEDFLWLFDTCEELCVNIKRKTHNLLNLLHGS